MDSGAIGLLVWVGALGISLIAMIYVFRSSTNWLDRKHDQRSEARMGRLEDRLYKLAQEIVDPPSSLWDPAPQIDMLAQEIAHLKNWVSGRWGESPDRVERLTKLEGQMELLTMLQAGEPKPRKLQPA